MLIQTKINSSSALFANHSSQSFKKSKKRKWKSQVAETIVDQFFVIPVTSTKMLRSEAYWMNNCCQEFAEQCARLEYNIFSIRSRSGERLATLGVINDNGYWRFDQCFGPSNSDVLEEALEYLDEDDVLQEERFPTELYYVAHEVVRMMNANGDFH